MALLGLFLSSMSLMILQSIMGGLQNGVVKRSKDIQGHYAISISEYDEKILENLNHYQFPFTLEYEIELLLKNGKFIAPTVIHAVHKKSRLPESLSKFAYNDGIYLGSELLSKIEANIYSEIQIISPAHTDSLLGDIPRQTTQNVLESIHSSVFEVDSFHSWIRDSAIFNLIRKKTYNKLRIYSSGADVDEFLKTMNEGKVQTWEDVNQSLVWALKLENIVMVSLFVIMTLLVSVSITSGLMLFFDKIKMDLISFWLVGMPITNAKKLCQIFILFISFISTFLGTLFGLVLLIILDRSSLEFMPDIFLEAKIPVLISTKATILSFLIPYLVCLIFSYLVISQLKNDKVSFLQQLRRNGQ